MDSVGVRPEIYSYGHRNPPGLLVDPRDGTVWKHEHGPKGGDEINRLRPGVNFGWPLTTHGVDYSGELISTRQTAEGIEPPVLGWVLSIALSGFALSWVRPFLSGPAISSWAAWPSGASGGCGCVVARWCCRRRCCAS